MVFLCVLLLSASFSLSFSKGPVAETENGPVLGIYETSVSGHKYLSFRGIPYARPPIGDLRFKEPMRLEGKWVGTWNGQKFGSECLQLNQMSRTRHKHGYTFEIEGQEDCLFINVYVPEGGSSNKTVLFGIPGGSFTYGSGNAYGPEYLMDHQDIIVVYFNYRVGALGFASTGDKYMTGNYGLKDQVAALKWVHRNIQNFRGDPSKVTIFGLSAGGASVDLMYMSPQTEGLFTKGLSFSGSALNSWVMPPSVKRTKKLAKLLGCSTSNSQEISKCLRERPGEKILTAVNKLLVWLSSPYVLFGAVIETEGPDPFLKEHPRDILRKGQSKDLPWLVGTTSQEGLYPAVEFIQHSNFMKELNDDWDRIAPAMLANMHPGKAKLARTHYIGDGNITSNSASDVIRVLGDYLFNFGIVETVRLRAATNKSPVYVYRYAHKGTWSASFFLSQSTTYYGTSHGDDFAHILKFPGPSYVEKDDLKVGCVVRDIFTTFATSGTVPKNYSWPTVSSNNIRYLLINSPDDIHLSEEPLRDEVGASKISPEYSILEKDEL